MALVVEDRRVECGVGGLMTGTVLSLDVHGGQPLRRGVMGYRSRSKSRSRGRPRRRRVDCLAMHGGCNHLILVCSVMLANK